MVCDPNEFPSATTLAERYSDQGEHPRLPREDWKREVTEDETTLSYWDWVEKEVWLAGGESELEEGD